MPLRPRLLLSLLIAVGLAATAAYLLVDRPLTETVTAWPAPVLEVFEVVTELGHSTKYIVASAVVALLFHFAWRRARTRDAALLILGAIVLPGLLVNLLKVLIGRARPHRWLQKGEWGFDPFTVDYDYSSMPSGHSSTIFGLAVALSIVFPRWRALWFTIALVVGFSRIVVEAHYLSDVIAGATLGSLIALAWAWRLRRWGLDPRPASARRSESPATGARG